MGIRISGGHYEKKFPTESSLSLRNNVSKTEDTVTKREGILYPLAPPKSKSREWEQVEKKEETKETKKADSVFEKKNNSLKQLFIKIGQAKTR